MRGLELLTYLCNRVRGALRTGEVRSHSQIHATNMFVLLLLASKVAGEWVEIAQHQHPQEPLRRLTVRYEETTKANKIYINYTLTERPWHRNSLTKIPNFGSVKRVQLQKKDIDVLTENTREKLNNNGRYEYIDSVRAPNIKIKDNIKPVNVKRKANLSNEINHNFEKRNETNIKLRNPQRYFVFGTEKTFSESSNIFKENTYLREKNNFQEVTLSNLGDTTRVLSDYNSAKVMHFGKDDSLNLKQYFGENGNKVGSNADNMDTILNTTKENQKAPAQSDIKNIFNITLDKQEIITEESDVYRDQNKESQSEYAYLGDNLKPKTFEVIWKLMKVVTDTISRNTRQNYKSKIKYLENLRKNIIANIEDWIELTWPEDSEVRAPNGKMRQRRAARGHVEFPSSESALMTISFLTFAVFLIKLVLQVIHTYKNKTMMVTPAVVAAVGRAAVKLRKQTRV